MAVHVSALLIPMLSEALSKGVVVILLTCVVASYALSETVRLRGGRIPMLTWFTERMSREDEKAHFVISPVFLAVGVILSLMLFPARIAYASISVVAVGDPVACYVGQRFGRMRVGRKTLEGSLAGFLTSFLVASMWVGPTLSLAGSLSGMLLELLGILNDNLTMPIGAGSTMYAATLL